MIKSFLGPALAGLFIFVGCTSDNQKILNQPVMRVNEHELSAKEFANSLARQLKNYDSLTAKSPMHVKKTKDQVLQDFIVRSLVLDYAVARGILISETMLEAEITKHRATYPDDLSFRRSLAMDNISFSEWQENLRFELLQKAVFKELNSKVTPPTDNEIQSYYESNKEHFSHKEKIFISQIVVQDEAKLDALRAGLKTASFKEYAEKFSIAPEGKKGGVVGWIEKGSVDFFDPLFSAPLNSLQVVKSPFGFHLVKVEKRIPGGFRPLSEVKPLVLSEVLGQREQAQFMSWLDSQIRSSKILKNTELIEEMKVETVDEK